MVLKKAGLSLDDLQLLEIGEDSACTPLVSLQIAAGGDARKIRDLQAKTNLNGGTLATGNPEDRPWGPPYYEPDLPVADSRRRLCPRSPGRRSGTGRSLHHPGGINPPFFPPSLSAHFPPLERPQFAQPAWIIVK